MIAFFRRRPFLLWTLCITLLVVRISGAHWHLCFDGSEPPATVHAGDTVADHHTFDRDTDDHHSNHDHNAFDALAWDHHAAEPHTDHTDVDLNLVDNGLFKLLAKHFAAALTLLAFFLLTVLTRRNISPPYFAPFFPQFALHRSPPPRGPPR
jgi:hypothetical protein